MTESFAEHPVSINEVKSERSGDSADWTPRDVLVKVLRMIDSGEISPDVLVVAYGQHVEGKRTGHFWQSTPDGMLSLGLMQSTIFKMQD
jgi:hypothetical protein